MKILIWDIETMVELFLVGIYLPEDDKYIEFEVSKNKYGLEKFIKFTEQYSEYHWVGYNNIRFDSQVIEWILHTYHTWEELGNLEICARIAQKAQDVIHDANYDVFPEYRESEISLMQIDLFKINHFDNRNRMVSLKRLEFEMDLENIEEMPIHHTKIGMTNEDLQVTRDYCKNDIKATYEFYKITIGQTEHPLYKENNQIELRQDIEEEFGIKCLNYSDSKIGDEMIKKFYCQEKRISYNSLPNKGTFRKEILVKNCIASYIKFQTTQLKDFYKQIRGRTMTLKDEFLETINFHGQVYTFARGGLHTVNKPKIFEATEDHLIIDWDVSSYYPAIIINNRRYPAHLGIEFLRGYKQMFDRRLELKPLAKTDKRTKGIVGALKLAVNSVYGKSSDMQNWVYDRQLTMFTTITGELSLMMLIEAYELEGINIISANTDGVTLRIHKDKLDKMTEINQWWMDLTSYELEKTDYSKIVFSTVNDYIALKVGYENVTPDKKDEYIKKKGDFLTDFELHKNKSARICNLALEQYFVNNLPIEETIKNHKNIYDFAIRQKSSKDFHYEGINRKTNEKTIYNKLIRYYISNTGEKILKIKNPECITNAAPISQVDAGEWVAKVVNYLPKTTKVEDCDINFSYYIEKANRIVDNIAYEGRKHKQEHPSQLSLF